MGAVKGEAIELPPFLDPAAANAGPMSREGRGPIRLSRPRIPPPPPPPPQGCKNNRKGRISLEP